MTEPFNAAHELMDVGAEVDRIHALTWAANQLLLDQSDATLSELEYRDRISRLMTVAEDRFSELSDALDEAERCAREAESRARYVEQFKELWDAEADKDARRKDRTGNLEASQSA